MKIKKMTDEQCLLTTMELIEGRVDISADFVQNVDTGVLTHQMLRLSCGEHERVSAPVPLPHPLVLATATDTGASLN